MIETEEMMQVIDSVNKESTISVTGVVRERSSKNKDLATGEIEVVPEKIEILGKCIYNALPFEINQSKDADENTRLKYRYLDLRNPAVKGNIVLRSKIVAELRQKMNSLNFMEITTPILTCSSLVHLLRRAHVIISYHPENSRENFMHCHRHHSSSNRF